MSNDESGKSWWQTLPGILTGITATITALAGLLVAINQTGWFSRSDADKAKDAPVESSIPSTPAESVETKSRSAVTATANSTARLTESVVLPAMRDYGLGDYVFTLLTASLTPKNAETSTLKLRVRLLNNGRYPVNFWDRQFRLIVDGVPRAPTGGLNETVAGNAAEDGDVAFVVPRNATAVQLRILHGDDATDVPLGLRPSD